MLQKQKRDNREGYLSFVGGALRILLLWSNIPTLAAGKRASRQLRLVCEPFRAQKQLLTFAEQSKAHEQGLSLIDAPPQKQKRHPNGCRFCGGACLTKVEPLLILAVRYKFQSKY